MLRSFVDMYVPGTIVIDSICKASCGGLYAGSYRSFHLLCFVIESIWVSVFMLRILWIVWYVYDVYSVVHCMRDVYVVCVVTMIPFGTCSF